MELPEDVKEQLSRFEAAVASVETGLEPLLGADRRELEAQLTPVERAKVHVTLANAVSTLFCMYLKSVGLDPADHAVKRELERVELYKAKVDRAGSRAGKRGDGAGGSKLDVAAANRFIQHHGGLGLGEGAEKSKGQRAKKKGGGSSPAEDADTFLEELQEGGTYAGAQGKRKSGGGGGGKREGSKKGKKK